MKSKITALIKLARAGGTTFATEWLRTPNPDGYQRVVVNADNIRLSLYNQRYCSHGEEFVHAIENIMIRALLKNPSQHLLLDDTHTTVSSIRKVLQLDPDAEFIYIDTSPEECERRALACGHDDLVTKGVIRRMYENLRKLQFYAHEQWDINLLPEDKPEDYELLECRLMCAVEKIRQEVKSNV